jgi:hypothetical protein
MDDNPYRAPVSTDPVTIGVSSLSEKEIRAFVGKHASYYLKKWSAGLGGSGQARGFNWPGFLISFFWLAYRKMYWITAIVIGVTVIETVVEQIAVDGGFASEQGISAVSSLAGLIFSIVCGTFGNAWYLAHAKREIARVRALGLPDDAYHEALAKRGGTSFVGSLGLVFLFLVVLYAVGVAIDIFSSGE